MDAETSRNSRDAPADKAAMDPIKVPATMFRLAESYGFVLVPKTELETQISITGAVLNAAFILYDALDQIGEAAGRGDPAAAVIAIANHARAEVDSRFWHSTEVPR